MSLNAFLSQNVKKLNEVKFEVSDRFSEAFKLKPISAEIDGKLRADCMVQKINAKGKMELKFDTNKYTSKMVAATVSHPNLNNKELQDSYSVMGAEELITTMLLPGEYAGLMAKVQEVNGFKTYPELEEEAKN